MARWGLIVEQNVGYERRMWQARVVGHVDGTREEALAELRRRAECFDPERPGRVVRRRLYRDRDGFLLVLESKWSAVFHFRFMVAEELYDSAPPDPA
ncbi:hypothetical protein [Streptomyces sp. NPDC090022]|uniref:hypothetical protein n=1 Tax=Streptomyces sp. NPDC090022 TaxID=3365920 RepID=UPI00382210C8